MAKANARSEPQTHELRISLLESNQINTIRNNISSLRNYQVTGKRVLKRYILNSIRPAKMSISSNKLNKKRKRLKMR